MIDVARKNFIVNQFYDEERMILNKIREGKLLSKFPKNEAIAELIVSQAVSASECEHLFDVLIQKLENMSDDDWDLLKTQFPLYISHSYETYYPEDNHSTIPFTDNIKKG